MIAEAVLVLWVAVALVNGDIAQPVTGVFHSEAECRSQVAKLEAKMHEDGDDDGDALSGCVPVKVHRVLGGEKS